MYDHASPPLLSFTPAYSPLFSLVSFFFTLLSPSPPTFPLRSSSWFIISTGLLSLFVLSSRTYLLGARTLGPPPTFSLFSFLVCTVVLSPRINRSFSFDVRSFVRLSFPFFFTFLTWLLSPIYISTIRVEMVNVPRDSRTQVCDVWDVWSCFFLWYFSRIRAK